MTLIIHNENAMLELGSRLAAIIGKTTIIFLHGHLGTGKTTLARGFLRGRGYQGHVKSPTYTLVESYPFPQSMVYHFDLYRLRDAEELEYMGIQDYFVRDTVCLIEWPDYGAGKLPAPDLICEIHLRENGREVKITASSQHGKTILQELKTHYDS